LAASRLRARELIEEGVVLVDGIPAAKAATQVSVNQTITLARDDYAWVGRGALKLLGVLDPFGVDPAGCTCADLGSSTGGFTEVLLKHGAARIYAIDVGKGLLHYRLRDHERITLMEGVNARHLSSLPEPIDLLVGDLSFISMGLILPTVHRLLRPEGQAVILVKPQFEVGRSAVGRGGRVRSEDDREAAIQDVRRTAASLGFRILGSIDSPIPGAKAGNVEHFLHLTKLRESEVD
jgi:23S rRNA (cytidine1920-2'-O)/16S rRNA (cytidine1409-2'-O)-methyltransferase